MDTGTKQTAVEVARVVALCRELFLAKLHDYGAAWRIMRSTSITDQIYIKASRIRSLQIKGESRVGEGIEPEFVGILNYSVVGMIQLEYGVVDEPDLGLHEALELYDQYLDKTMGLLECKNHDYGEAWRQMRLESIVDLILSKIYRTKQIEDLDGKTLVSEGIEANYMDMANYAIFALIKLGV